MDRDCETSEYVVSENFFLQISCKPRVFERRKRWVVSFDDDC